MIAMYKYCSILRQYHISISVTAQCPITALALQWFLESWLACLVLHSLTVAPHHCLRDVMLCMQALLASAQEGDVFLQQSVDVAELTRTYELTRCLVVQNTAGVHWSFR
jgi:hypothetical protein